MKSKHYYHLMNVIEKYIFKNGAEDSELELHLNPGDKWNLQKDLEFMFGFQMGRFNDQFTHYGVTLTVIVNRYCYEMQYVLKQPEPPMIVIPSWNFPINVVSQIQNSKRLEEKEYMIVKNFEEKQKMEDFKLQLSQKEVRYRTAMKVDGFHTSIVVSEDDLYSYEFSMNGVNEQTIAVCASYAKRKVEEAINRIYNSSTPNWHEKEIQKIHE